MIAFLGASLLLLGALAWRFPRQRGWLGGALVVLLVGTVVWREFGPRTAPPQLRSATDAVARDTLALDGLALEPWFGEHRLSGTARNRSDTLVVTGFEARLELSDCVDGACTPLGTHRQRFNVRVTPGSAVAFERRVRLLPGTVLEVDGNLEFELYVDAVHGRADIRRER